jgi:hypothetical protein
MEGAAGAGGHVDHYTEEWEGAQVLSDIVNEKMTTMT